VGDDETESFIDPQEIESLVEVLSAPETVLEEDLSFPEIEITPQAPAPVQASSPPPQEQQVQDQQTPPQASSPAQSVSPSAPPDESIRVSTKKLERLLNYVGELTILQSVLTEQSYTSSSSELKKQFISLVKSVKKSRMSVWAFVWFPFVRPFKRCSELCAIPLRHSVRMFSLF
jgi:chemotaxis protein histidine kinase CheA